MCVNEKVKRERSRQAPGHGSRLSVNAFPVQLLQAGLGVVASPCGFYIAFEVLFTLLWVISMEEFPCMLQHIFMVQVSLQLRHFLQIAFISTLHLKFSRDTNQDNQYKLYS